MIDLLILESFFIPDENWNPRNPKSVFELRDFTKSKANIIRQETIDGTFISTVWLTNNHAFIQGGKPVHFETMIFSNHEKLENYQERYTNFADAIAGHERAVRTARKVLNEPQI